MHRTAMMSKNVRVRPSVSNELDPCLCSPAQGAFRKDVAATFLM